MNKNEKEKKRSKIIDWENKNKNKKEWTKRKKKTFENNRLREKWIRIKNEGKKWPQMKEWKYKKKLRMKR